MTELDRKGKVATRQKRRNQRRVEEILVRLANIPDFAPEGTIVTDRLLEIEESCESREARTKAGRKFAVTRLDLSLSTLQKSYPDIFGDCSEADLFALRHLLREAWQSADPRTREWFVFLLRSFHAEVARRKRTFDGEGGESLVAAWERRKDTIDRAVKSGKFNPAQMLYNVRDGDLAAEARKASPPEMTSFEQTFLHLQRNLHRAMVCRNPECPAPYFFRVKTGQCFCSTDCYEQMKRVRGRDWWSRNRAKRRKANGSVQAR